MGSGGSMTNKFLGEGLIFIISQPRSGSTLLQRVLAGSPDVQTSAETWLMLHPIYGEKREGIETEYNASWAREAVEEFLDNYTDGREVYIDAIRAWAEVIYSNALKQHNKSYFLDKTPRYFFIIRELYELFPDAKFIFLIRNPMAVLASELNTYIKGDWPLLGLFSPDLVAAPQWILDGIDLLGVNAITIRYEAFVSNPEKNISALCQKLGIKFHQEMLDYSKTARPVGKYNDSTGIDQHSSANTASIEKWKMMVDDDQSLYFARRYLDSLGEETITSLGYDYTEIFSVLHARTLSLKGLYPWSIAIRPESEWTFRQRFFSDYYFNRSAHGSLKGGLLTTFVHLKNLIRKLLNALSSPDSM
jgi:hypothetical protein